MDAKMSLKPMIYQVFGSFVFYETKRWKFEPGRIQNQQMLTLYLCGFCPQPVSCVRGLETAYPSLLEFTTT
jgi:hypothetical protein